ncbi:MAG: hypothetical protein NTZ56_06175 [Acidobacteria bacterium]|nr:hypothetical protein [Acidobacteriota bacterium]
MKYLVLLLSVAVLAEDHPTGPRLTPPTIRAVAPLGVSRGMSVEMTIEGFNLAGATQVFFSEPGVKAKIVRIKELPDLPDIRIGANGTQSSIDVGPLPPRNQITLEVEVAPETEIGPVNLRVQTPYGSSPVGTFVVEPYYGEAPDNEPNDSLDTAFETYLPAILAGTIARPGDFDMFKIKVTAGQTLTFENAAAMVGTQLMPVIEIVAPDMSVLKSYTEEFFTHKFAQAGTYYVRISDYQRKGSTGHIYRLKVGDFPLVTRAYPLGVRRGATAEIKLAGMNLGSGVLKVEGKPSAEDPDAVLARADAPSGHSFNRVRLDLGAEPEVEAASTKMLTLPVTVNGKITKGPHEFRFKATKGQEVVFEVKARRFGSELDSMLEVLDAKGLGDFTMIGNEVNRIEALPRGPDDDIILESFGGQRVGYFGTTPESHANEKSFYKVQVHPAGKQFSPNGLPLARIYYRNDDGGPGYGKDSLLRFVAPADGEYMVRLADVRGQGSEAHSYRLTARAPRPDFKLTVTPRNPNIPAGGSVPLTVTALRMEGFADKIDLELPNLPPGITATKGQIGKGQTFGTILLTAAADANLPVAAPLKLMGSAAGLTREANPEDRLKLITLGPKPDVVMTAETLEVVLEPGGTAEVKVSIKRQNGFGGRVPVDVRGLPPRVRVLDVGLNGVLLNEDETTRSFTLEALSSAEEVEQMIYVSGTVETRSPQQNSYAAPQAIRLRVKRPPTATQ